MKHCALLGALALVWAGCSSPSEVEDPEQVLVVQAFLSPGRDVELRLRQTLPPERFYDGLEDTVRSADVQISTDEGTFSLAERAEEPGLYWLDAGVLPVVEGQTYELHIRHGGRQLRAATTVPFRAEITRVIGDTITYLQRYADSFGELQHPGEFYWERSENAAGYVVIVEAVDVRSLPVWADPLTADLDTLVARRERLEGRVSADSLEALDRQIQALRDLFAQHISLVDENGDPIRWLRDRDQKDWDKIDGKDWSEGKKWRKKREELFSGRVIDYWMPADSTRSDFWWLGVRFEAEYQIRLQAADRNYFDYYTTAFNGQSGSDGDNGPLFNVQGGTGVFGSYTEASFRVYARRGEEGSLKVVVGD